MKFFAVFRPSGSCAAHVPHMTLGASIRWWATYGEGDLHSSFSRPSRSEGVPVIRVRILLPFPFLPMSSLCFLFVYVSRFCAVFSVRSILVVSLSRVSLGDCLRLVHLRQLYLVTSSESLGIT